MNRKVTGKLTGLRKSQISRLEALYDFQVERSAFISEELVSALTLTSMEISREIAIYLNRKGTVVDVSVGDRDTVNLGEVSGRRGSTRTSGIRCIHTHPGGSPDLSDVDISALEILNLDAMAAIGCSDSREPEIQVYVNLGTPEPGQSQRTEKHLVLGPMSIPALMALDLMDIIKDLQPQSINHPAPKTETEKAILVALQSSGVTEEITRESLDELSQLADSAGVQVVWKTVQSKPRPDAGTYIGRGKASEIKLEAQVLGVDVLIFDDELSPAQQRNLEALTGIKIIDRTALILDIFAQRARTMEGKIQVELAQLNYLLPRLTGQGTVLSRLGGGIGTRGPGETKLEVDRRRIRRRIADLSHELETIRKHRRLHRTRRKAASLPIVSLCGYTNAGKSTLLNQLTNSDVLAEDRLFATLDPTTRYLILPGNQTVVISDTVGFIRKIPHHLIAAFRATLEEVVESDLLVHVVDISHPAREHQMQSVTKLLNELGVGEKATLIVFNKTDRINESSRPSLVNSLANEYPNSVFVSAETGQGMSLLLERLSKALPGMRHQGTYEIPYSESSLAAKLHEMGKVLRKEYLPDHILLTVELDSATADLVADFRKEEN